jgi:hypothetical protein
MTPAARSLSVLTILFLATATFAQPAPPPPGSSSEGRDQGKGPPPPQQNDDDRGAPGGSAGREVRRGPGGPAGPGSGPGAGPGERRPDGHFERRVELRPGTFDQMRGYLDLVERYQKVAADPTAAAVAAVVQTADILRPRGPQAVIDHFEKLLPEVKNEAVARAIRLQLIDQYRQTQQPDKAVEQLSSLIRAAPGQER